MATLEKIKTDEECIQDFLCDISCLDELSKEFGKFNIFDVLKITRTEIRHSNMLAWLLDPNANHGLNDKVLKELFKWFIKTYSVENQQYYSFLLECDKFEVVREWHNIDILLVSDQEKTVVCIENKVDSGEHDNQLNRYRKIVEEYYADYKKIFLYLTPNGSKASNEEWKEIGYDNFYNFIQYAMEHTVVANDIKILINNYLDIIKRDIMTNEELMNISQKIYNKHKQALDIIFKYRTPEINGLLNSIGDGLFDKGNGDIVFNQDKKTKFFATHFNTSYLNELIPTNELPSSEWKTFDNYYYELATEEKDDNIKISLKLVFSRTNLSPEVKKTQDKIIDLLESKGKIGEKYKTVKSKTITINKSNIDSSEIIEKKVDELLTWINNIEEKIRKHIN